MTSSDDGGLGRNPGARARLMTWASGRRPTTLAARQSVVCASPHVVDAIHDRPAVHPDALVFAPIGSDANVRYSGALSEAGVELTIGDDFLLQTQGYAISEYVSVIGPTLIRLSDEEDLRALAEDGRAAYEMGMFPEFLTNPIIQLADVPALGLRGPGSGPHDRLWVDEDGTVSVSPAGLPLGDLDTDVDSLHETWEAEGTAHGDPDAIGRSVPRDVVQTVGDGHPFLPRFVAALDGQRNLRARGVALPRVSGFGGFLRPELAQIPTEDLSPDAPFVMWSEDRHFLVSGDGSRVFEVSRTAAQAFETVIVHGDDHGAADDSLGVDAASTARRVLDESGLSAAAPRAVMS